MKAEYKKISDTKAELVVESDEKILAEVKKQTLTRMQPEVSAPGFRKGKVPLNIVEKNVDDNYLKSQFLDDALNVLYNDALREHKLRPLSQPEVEIKKFVPFTELSFKVTVDVVPPVKLGDYKKISQKLDVKVPTDDEVSEVVENLRGRLAEKKEVDRAVKDGDEVHINFKGTNEKGEDVAGATGKDYPLRIGSNTFIDGFEEELVGMKPGDKKEFTLRFPKDYAHKPLANKKVTFATELIKVEELELPKLDGAFAQKVGPFKTMAELKKDIKEQLTKQKEQEADDKLKDAVVGELVESSKVEAPDVLVDENIEAALNEFKQNLVYRGITFPEYLEQAGLSEEEYRDKELRPRAETRVKTGLVLAEVADAEDVQVTPEELEIRMQLLRGQHQNDPQMLAQLNSPDAEREIASRMVTEKTVDLLVDMATKKK